MLCAGSARDSGEFARLTGGSYLGTVTGACEGAHRCEQFFANFFKAPREGRSGGRAPYASSVSASISRITIAPFSIAMNPERFQSCKCLLTLSREPPTSSPSARCDILTPTGLDGAWPLP